LEDREIQRWNNKILVKKITLKKFNEYFLQNKTEILLMPTKIGIYHFPRFYINQIAVDKIVKGISYDFYKHA